MTATAVRGWKTSTATTANPAGIDTLEDFDFDYVDYQISAQFGNVAESSNDAYRRFDAITVPFATF